MFPGLQSCLQWEKARIQRQMGKIGVRKEGNEKNIGKIQQYCQGKTKESCGWIEQVYEWEAKTDSDEETIEQALWRIWTFAGDKRKVHTLS